jgi:hypothetical protein
MATEYRILPVFQNNTNYTIGCKFLQFKSKKIVQKSKGGLWNWLFGEWLEVEEKCWRFVPNEIYVKVTGNFLSETKCPEYVQRLEDKNRFLCSSSENDTELRDFTASYPDISDYFKRLKILRREYLIRMEQIDPESEIEYLGKATP